MINSVKLRASNTETVFGVGGKWKVFINPLWPEAVDLILRQAIQVSKTVDYERPIIGNLTVCMKGNCKLGPSRSVY